MSYHLYLYRQEGAELLPAEVVGFARYANENLRDFCKALKGVTEVRQVSEAGPHPELYVQRPVDLQAARKLLAELGGNASVDLVLQAMQRDAFLFWEVSN